MEDNETKLEMIWDKIQFAPSWCKDWFTELSQSQKVMFITVVIFTTLILCLTCCTCCCQRCIKKRDTFMTVAKETGDEESKPEVKVTTLTQQTERVELVAEEERLHHSEVVEEVIEEPLDQKVLKKKQRKLTSDKLDELVDDVEKLYEVYFHFKTGARLDLNSDLKKVSAFKKMKNFIDSNSANVDSFNELTQLLKRIEDTQKLGGKKIQPNQLKLVKDIHSMGKKLSVIWHKESIVGLEASFSAACTEMMITEDEIGDHLR